MKKEPLRPKLSEEAPLNRATFQRLASKHCDFTILINSIR